MWLGIFLISPIKDSLESVVVMENSIITQILSVEQDALRFMSFRIHELSLQQEAARPGTRCGQ